MSLLAAYYADDFTGATDALDSLSRGGIRTKLYLKPPRLEHIPPGVRVIGIAGATRSMTPDRMGAELGNVVSAVSELKPRFLHYKVCSTFDSSPQRGNLGVVESIAHRQCPGEIPVVLGTTRLGRYVAFGHLFARHSDGHVYRLDRHPVMACHPVTPMREASIAAHLHTMSDAPTRNVTAEDFAVQDTTNHAQAPSNDRGFVIYDTVTDEHQRAVARILDADRKSHHCRFVIGSSGFSDVLAIAESPQDPTATDSYRAVEQVAVFSGSRSITTRRQIDAAVRAGFELICIDPDDSRAWSAAARDAVTWLRRGRSIVIDTARADSRQDADAITRRFSALVVDVLSTHSVPRAVVCGGDTSSAAGQALAITSIDFHAPLAPGAPLCDIDSPLLSQVAFKGGQMGDAHYLLRALSPAACELSND